MAFTIGGFLIGAWLELTTIALVCLALSIPLMVADEVGFHRGLQRRERLVHLGEGLALTGFIVVWVVTDLTP